MHASVLGTRFTGRLVGTTKVGGFDAVVPTVRGRAWVTGLATYLLDPDDPFPAGFLLGARSLTGTGPRVDGGRPGGHVRGSWSTAPCRPASRCWSSGRASSGPPCQQVGGRRSGRLPPRPSGPAAGTSSAGEGNVLVSDKVPGPDLALALRGVELWRELAGEAGEAGAAGRVRGQGRPRRGPRREGARGAVRLRRVAAPVGSPRRVVAADALRELEPALTEDLQRRGLLRAGLPGPAHGGRRLPRPPVRRPRRPLGKGGRGRRRGARQAGERPLGPHHRGHRFRRHVRRQRRRPVGGRSRPAPGHGRAGRAPAWPCAGDRAGAASLRSSGTRSTRPATWAPSTTAARRSACSAVVEATRSGTLLLGSSTGVRGLLPGARPRRSIRTIAARAVALFPDLPAPA